MLMQKNTMKDIKKTAHQLQEQLCDKADDLQDAAYKAGQKMRDFSDKATHEARDAVAATEKNIRKHPLAAGAIVSGVSFLLGALLRRRQK